MHYSDLALLYSSSILVSGSVTFFPIAVAPALSLSKVLSAPSFTVLAASDVLSSTEPSRCSVWYCRCCADYYYVGLY